LVEINPSFILLSHQIISHLDIPLESNAKVYAGKLASDASTQYILIKPDTTQTNLITIS